MDDRDPERSNSQNYRCGIAIDCLSNKLHLMICGSSILRDADKHTIQRKTIWTACAKRIALRTRGYAFE